MYLSKCSPACGSAIVLQLSYLWVFSCMCCSTWMVLPCPACFIWPELSPLTEKHRCHKWRSKRCIVSFQIWESNQAWEGSWSLYSSAKGGTRKSVGRGLDGHYPQWQQISFWCSTTLPIFNSSSLTRGARSPDTQHWWNVFPTGQSKRNGMKIWEHRALPPKEPSCQMTNIIDCNLLTFLCGDWVDRYSTFIIPYPGTLETCFRRIGRARSCTLLLVSLLSSSMFTCFYLYIIQFNVFDHCPSHMALVWVMLMPHAECYGWAFNWSRCSCHTGSNYIIKKNTELQIQQRMLWIKICWNRLKQKLTIWVGMHLHNDKILPAPHPREFEAPTQSKSGHPTGSSQLYGSDCGKVNES